MPLYEYRCKECGHRFEKIQSFSASDEKECPLCKSEVERLISAPAVHFSGSGFYSTDYPSKSSAAPKTAEGGSKDGASTKDGTSSKSEGGKDSSSASSSDSGSKSSSDSSSSAPAASPAPASSSTSSKE
jgi:putative FmdB family regulatory protein